MIITGKCRQNGAQLGTYLVDNQKDVNENVRIFEVKGTTSRDAKKAILEMSLAAELTKGKLGLYHATINPDQEKDSVMTDAEYQQAIEILEKELGLSGQNRVAVIHEKIGQDGYLRQHMHVVWQREKEAQLIASSHNYKKHDAAREQIEIALKHERTYQSTDMKDILTRAYNQSKTGAEFVKKAAEHGYRVGQGYTSKQGGSTRGFCVVDSEGRKVNLARQILGVKHHQIKEHLKDVEASLPKEQDLEGYKVVREKEKQKNRREETPSDLTKFRQKQFAINKEFSAPNMAKNAEDRRRESARNRRKNQDWHDFETPISQKENDFEALLKAFNEKQRQEEIDRSERQIQEYLARSAGENASDVSEANAAELTDFEKRLQAAQERREDIGRELEME